MEIVLGDKDKCTWFGKKCYLINFGSGQGARRTAMNEAACKVLGRYEFNAMMFYQMD